MKAIMFSVIIPVVFIIGGIIMILFKYDYGVLLTGAGVLWLVISFLIGYKENEEQPLGMGRGRQR
jgi:hypothetical protein